MPSFAVVFASPFKTEKDKISTQSELSRFDVPISSNESNKFKYGVLPVSSLKMFKVFREHDI